uniref:Uncharacterized protein n=1 Tax=Bosea sp. NBC_00436 TaxID=2969620 RepID=A0A9E8CSX6_9HYPH
MGERSKPVVTVTVSAPVGSGKSAICGEIEIALKAIGVPVTWRDGASEKRLTRADWQGALDLYEPSVVIREENPHMERARICQAAEQASGAFGQWVPQAWLDAFMAAYQSNPKASSRG